MVPVGRPATTASATRSASRSKGSSTGPTRSFACTGGRAGAVGTLAVSARARAFAIMAIGISPRGALHLELCSRNFLDRFDHLADETATRFLWLPKTIQVVCPGIGGVLVLTRRLAVEFLAVAFRRHGIGI